MPKAAALALAASVSMHVSWNMLARHSSSSSEFLWWALLGFLALCAPWSIYYLVLDARWSRELILLLALTSLANSVYFASLGKAYRYAPVLLVYPIARSSPLLIAIWSSVLLGETMVAEGWIGIMIMVAGLTALASSAEHTGTHHGLPWALTAALATSIYSLSNKAAVISLPTYRAQLGYVSVALGTSFVWLSILGRFRNGSWRPRKMPPVKKWLPAGICIGNAYALVVFAMQYVAAAYAIAYTNAGIVLASLISIFWFRERVRWRQRLIAITTIVVGLTTLSLSR